MTGAVAEFDLAIRSCISIAAAPAVVWDWLGDMQSWKASVVSIERLAGEPGAEGEILRVGQRPVDETVHTLMRTVRTSPPTWKVQTLQVGEGREIDGYVAYTLEPATWGTRISCEVIARCRLPVPAGVESVDAFARAANASTLAKLDADHAVLKALVEKERAP